MIIRPAEPDDTKRIRDLNISAFNGESEADIVEGLALRGVPLISLVAEDNDKIIGHILFSPVTLESDEAYGAKAYGTKAYETKAYGTKVSVAGLAPMSVLPDLQRNGIGSKLVEVGLKRCKEAGYDAAVVLGHPQYYPRFGFAPSIEFGIKSEFDVPDDVFMILELTPHALDNCHGIVKYNTIFSEL